MGDECTQLHHMLLLIVIVAVSGMSGAICPSRCRCNDDILQVSCIGTNLEVVPIQLNPEVRHIDISHNKISNVVFTLSFYNNLDSLNLAANKITTLGSSNFESQRHLKQLNLSSNELETLSKDSLKGLRALTHLDLSFNQIEEISVHAFRDLHSLEVLRLTGNRLIRLEDGLLKAASMLYELYLDDNQLIEMPGRALTEAFNLHRLSLSDNLILSVSEGDMPDLPDLQILQLDNNVINEIEAGALSGLSALEYLDLSDNNFTAVPTIPLAKLSNLTKLRFSGNFIRAIPPVAFRGLFQLRFLYLSRLEFLTLIDSRSFVDNINLERIWLDDNIAIDTLPTRLFYGNPRLSHISVRNNQLSTLEASHFPLDQLHVLKVGGNPLECNCSMLWLWRLGREQKLRPVTNETTVTVTAATATATDLYIDIEHVECAGPEQLHGQVFVGISESQVGCSISWLAAAVIVLLVFTCLAAALTTLLLWGPLKRRLRQPELPPIEHSEYHHQHPNGTSLAMTYEDPRVVDKYIIGTSIVHEYRALPPWDPYGKECGNVYAEYDTPITKTRPHIVYV